MSHVLVTGANGLVGIALCRALRDAGHIVTGLVRRATQPDSGLNEWIDPGPDFVGIDTSWRAESQIDCVVHLAARAHVLHDTTANPDAAFHATNVDGALRVAQAARRRGVRRFVFVSSIKALAESDAGRPLREDDPPLPKDAYGRSKLAAEQALLNFGKASGMEVVIVRPPLIYGPRVRANFLSLMDGIWKGMPLPLGLIEARRSLVYVENFADALVCCATDPRAVNQCFHVADAEALTVAELVRSLGRHLHRPARLLPVPKGLLRAAGRLTGRSSQIDRLVGSLQLDTTHIRTTLGWKPPYSADEGLAATACWYRSTHQGRAS